MARDHYWVNPSGLSKADKDKIRRATATGGHRTTDGREGVGRRMGHGDSKKMREKIPPGVLPNQYIGKGPAAKKAAEQIAKQLKGAKVVVESFGAQSTSQSLWERLAHSLIDRILKGKR